MELFIDIHFKIRQFLHIFISISSKDIHLKGENKRD